MIHPSKKNITPEEYLAREEKAEFRSEYRNGEIVALAGASLNHNQIVQNLSATLDRLLEHKDCRVFTSDVRLRVEKSNLYSYPDVMIVCGKIETDPRQTDTLTNPTVIIEVWSDSTQSYDRTDKFASYRKTPSLREYVMVDQSQPYIEHYRREGHFWVLETYEQIDAILALRTLECEIPLTRIYRKVEWEEKPKQGKRNKKQ